MSCHSFINTSKRRYERMGEFFAFRWGFLRKSGTARSCILFTEKSWREGWAWQHCFYLWSL